MIDSEPSRAAGAAQRRTGFLAELRRRNVIRMAGLYLVGAWLIVQVAETLLPVFGAPGWVLKTLVMLVALGFVPALVFAWVFELTPEGLKRDDDVPVGQSIAPETARRMDRMIIAVLVLALVYFGVDKFVLAPSRVAKKEMGAESLSGPAIAAVPAAPAPEVDSDPISRKSIAVLPFVDLSPDRDQEYFSDGMAEEILDALAQVEDLKVAGRTSSFYFKGKNEKLQTIGEALGVAHVLEGSVRKQGDKVRITAQLIQTKDGFHLWSESYNGDLSDVFELQERIARSIVEKLKVILKGRQENRLAQESTSSPEAHQHFLRGRYFWNRRGLVNLQSAEEAFKAALAADPDYVDAWAGLAQTYAIIPEYSIFDPAGDGRLIDTVSEALDAANEALRRDPASSRALSARAYVRSALKFDWAGAEADFRAALASDPRDSTAHQWYGEMLTFQRRWSEANVQYDSALVLDPLAPIIHFARGLSRWYQGDPAAAIPDLEESLRLAPDLFYAHVTKALILVELRRFDEALLAARALPATEQKMMASFIAAMQDRSKLDVAVQQIIAHGLGGVTGKPVMLAMLGENDLALTELERLFAERDPLRQYLYPVPQFEPLHRDPRFQALQKQIRLPVETSSP